MCVCIYMYIAMHFVLCVGGWADVGTRKRDINIEGLP